MAAARVVSDGPDQLILIISAKAQVVRITLEDVRVTGRNTQGVIVWRDREPDDYVASIAVFQESDTQSTKEEDSNNTKPVRTRSKASKVEDHEIEVDDNGETPKNDDTVADDLDDPDSDNGTEDKDE